MEINIRPYSASRLQLIDSCPASFFLSYVAKKDQTQNLPGQIGSTMHTVLEHYVKYLYETKQMQDLSKLEQFARKYARPEEITEIAYLIKRYADTHIFEDFDKEVYFEKKLALTEDLQPSGFDSKNSWIRGIIDRLTIDKETATIIDYKSNRIIPTDSEWQNMLQKQMYIVLVAHNFPQIKKIKVEFHYVRYNVVMRDEIEPTKLNLRPLIKTIQAKIELIEDFLHELEKIGIENWQKVFFAKPGGFCMLCGVWHQCPLKDNPYLDVRANPEKAAGSIKLLERQLKELKKAVEAYVQENGPIDLGNDKAEFKLYKNAEVINSREFVRRLVKEKGVDKNIVWDNIAIPKKTVEAIQRDADIEIIQKNGVVNEEWEDIVLPKFTKRFGIYKKEAKYKEDM